MTKRTPKTGKSRRVKAGGGPTRRKATKPSKRVASVRDRAWRLPPDIRPRQVDVHVEVDPSRSRDFRGEVTLELDLERGARSLALHAADLRTSHARLLVDGKKMRGRIEPRPEREAILVHLPEPVPAGRVSLSLSFRGKLRSDLRGLYAARSGERSYAFTQLEAADARRFFPCLDEPAMKARFRLSVTTDKTNTVLSNNPVEKIEPLPGGRKTVHFQRTPPLSTYLLALAVGELDASPATHCGATEIRVWHVPKKEKLTAFALETARETLSRLETYFGLPYPYEKLDLVAAPDFEAGAMENAGAVFFRETLLLLDPETATLQEKKRVAEVVCHELAHMWYGDLVTMAWWDDLWLNEAFATWMAFQIVDAWRPEWKMWSDFQHYRSAALGLDALEHTHPIYTQVRTPSEATENFDLITYEKGASVVRMLERYLGAVPFRAGVRRYIRRHRESNTVAADLWNALAEASGQDVEAIVRPWIEQSGFPLLEVRRAETKAGSVLRFRQERFRARPEKESPKRAKAVERWPIPWVGRVGTGGRRSKTLRHLVTKARDQIPLTMASPRFVYGNADEGGFFRPLHTTDELGALAASLSALTSVERMGLLGHQWAALRAGRADVGSFLDLALAFGDEEDADVLLTLRAPFGMLGAVVRRTLGDDSAAALHERIEQAFTPALEDLGLDTRKGEDDSVRLRRAALLVLLGEVCGREDVVGEAAQRGVRYLEDRRAIDPNLADPVVNLTARDGDEALFERYLAAASSAATPQDRRRFLMALGEFRKPQLVARVLSLTLSESVGTQDVAILLTRLLGNRAAREATWSFMKRRWPALRRRMPPMLVTRPIEATPALGTAAYRRDVASFFRANPVSTGARAVRQALEQFDLNLAFGKRATPGLRRWLDD